MDPPTIKLYRLLQAKSLLCTLFRNTYSFPCLIRKVHITQSLIFYIRGSVHRNSRLKKSNEMQQYADIYLLLNYSTCFGRPSRPLSGVHKIVVSATTVYVLLMMGAMDA